MNLMKPLLALSLLTAAANATATDGYFAHGYGVKSQGMGGVGIALPQDAIAAASNPAGMGLIGDRMDVGMTWFRPQRQSEIRQRKKIIVCENCGRILVDSDLNDSISL